MLHAATASGRVRPGARRRHRVAGGLVALALAAWTATGCGPATPTTSVSPPQPTVQPATAPAVQSTETITIGDVDPDEPAKKVKRFTPLADYLASHLSEFGFVRGRVLVAKDLDEMGRLMAAGTVDIYFDSPFPTLAVKQIAGSEIILRRWKGGLSEYWSTFVARKDGEVEEVGDLLGKVVAFEEPRSTSGFVLPAGTLIQRGFTVIEVEGPNAEVRPDEIGYLFSRDEENTFEMVLSGKVAAGGVSNEDYEELSDEIMSQIVTLDQTIKVPRQLVSVRPGLDPQVVDRVSELLVGLGQSEEGMRLLVGLKTTKFDPLPAQEQASLRQVREIMRLIAE